MPAEIVLSRGTRVAFHELRLGKGNRAGSAEITFGGQQASLFVQFQGPESKVDEAGKQRLAAEAAIIKLRLLADELEHALRTPTYFVHFGRP